MKLIRFGGSGEERPGVLMPDGSRVAVSGLVRDYDEDFFTNNGISELDRWLRSNLSTAPKEDPAARLGPPICRPSKIVCIGLNFRDHARESGMEIPDEPVIFLKSTSSLVGPNDDLVIPRNGNKVDWEVEFAAIVAKKASYVDPKVAMQYVAGYALHNDYSERGFQFEHGGQWVKGKSADTFAPLGPFVATCDELADVSDLGMWLKVNGVCKQRSSTREMIFDIPSLLGYVTQFMTLLPGDVLSTGTPSGVGLGRRPPEYLRAGDVVELGIDGLGESRQSVIAPHWGGPYWNQSYL
jgi:2,4-didehydro-3-deoxy-L-rhamnonate hydrolase